jgi:hypothetical protein
MRCESNPPKDLQELDGPGQSGMQPSLNKEQKNQKHQKHPCSHNQQEICPHLHETKGRKTNKMTHPKIGPQSVAQILKQHYTPTIRTSTHRSTHHRKKEEKNREQEAEKYTCTHHSKLQKKRYSKTPKPNAHDTETRHQHPCNIGTESIEHTSNPEHNGNKRRNEIKRQPTDEVEERPHQKKAPVTRDKEKRASEKEI